MTKEEQQRKIEETIEKLEKVIKQTGVKDIDMDGIREAAYLRRHARLDKMRGIVEEAKKLGANKAIIKSMVEDDVVVDGGELGLGKVEYAWNKFVAMYFRYANPRDQVNPDPIRCKLTGVFKGIGDLCAWLGTEQMKYSGFWQGVVKNWANTFIGCINGVYAKLWIPETSPLTFTDSDGHTWVIPEVTAEYTTADESEGAPTRVIERAFAFKHVCYHRQRRQWVNPAPYPHNDDFHEERAAVIYDIQFFTSKFVNDCAPGHRDVDDKYWEAYCAKPEAFINQNVNNYSFCAPEDFMWNQVGWTDDYAVTSNDFNRMAHFDMNIYSDAISDPNAPNQYKIIMTPYNEVVTFGADYTRGWCEYENEFAVVSIAKIGWPPVSPQGQIIGLATARIRPYADSYGHKIGDTAGDCWWAHIDDNDGLLNVAGINPTYGSSPHDNPISPNDWIGKKFPNGTIPAYSYPMYSMYDGTDTFNLPTGCQAAFLDPDTGALKYREGHAAVNPGCQTDHQGGWKDITFMIIEQKNGLPGHETFHYPESHIIKKMGTIFAEYTVHRHDNEDISDDYWMIGYSYNVGSETRYKYFNEEGSDDKQQWSWTEMSGVTEITAYLDIPEGTQRHEIFLFCNQAVGCDREQQLWQQVTLTSSKIAKIVWKVRTRHNHVETHSRRFTYYIIWPVDRQPPSRSDLKKQGIMHPTADTTYEPVKDDMNTVGHHYVAETKYVDDNEG